MMLVVSVVTAVGLVFAQRNVAENVKRDFEREFQGELSALHAVQDVRHAVLAERCRALARRPRIHAALEDGAPDLLYPSARDELLDMMDGEESSPREPGIYALHARYYRFLDSKGRVVSPPDAKDVGELAPGEESQLDLGALPATPQTGYVLRKAGGPRGTIDEVIAMPIVSTENGDVISAIVLGFRPSGNDRVREGAGIESGLWVSGRLDLPSLPSAAREGLAADVYRAITASPSEGSEEMRTDGARFLLFYKRINPGSLFPPAYEVSLYPLADSLARQRRLLWQFVGTGLLLVLGAFGLSNLLSTRLSEPVEKLGGRFRGEPDAAPPRRGRPRAQERGALALGALLGRRLAPAEDAGHGP